MAAVLLAGTPMAPAEPGGISLDEALREARSANARLPVPALDVAIAREKLSETLAERWLKVAVEGDFVYAPANGYDPALTNLGEARLQAVVRQPIYAGGALRAASARAAADVEAAAARYRIAEKDLDLEVRSRFSEMLEAGAEVRVRRDGIDRLETYRTSLRSRQASGQALAADLLKTEVRLALEKSAVTEAEQRSDQARLALNELMGRDPAAPLELEPEPNPSPPSHATGSAWEGAPEIAAAQAEARSAEATLALAHAERRPHLFARADTGFWSSDTTHLKAAFWDQLWGHAGYSFSLVLTWPVWDAGATRARITQAQLGLQQLGRKLEIQRRDSRLNWEQARAAAGHLYEQIQILSHAAPDARDSYLEAESRYRGGAASALEVLDAYTASVDAAVQLHAAIARYRVAEAVVLRWSEP
jgi:outer membrane protein